VSLTREPNDSPADRRIRSDTTLESSPGRDRAAADRIIRLGLWAIPTAGVVIGAHWLFPEGPPTADGVARHFTSIPTLIAQEYVLFLGGLLLLLFGVIAISAYLANAGVRTSAIVGMVLSVSGIALFLPIVGIPILVNPVLGKAYLSGHPEMGAAMQLFSPMPHGLQGWLFVHAIFALVISIAGAIAMAVAIWRSGKFPRWAAIVYAIAFSLVMTDTPVVAWIGYVLLISAGGRIAAVGRVR
jgi:hypothetical protein